MVFVAKFYQFLLFVLGTAGFLLTIYKYLLIANVIISWVNADPYNPIVNFIYRVTEPVLKKIRRFMPDTGAIDLSPIAAFLIIAAIQYLIIDVAEIYLNNAFKAAALPTYRGF